MNNHRNIPIINFKNIATELPFKIQAIHWSNAEEKKQYEQAHSQDYFEILWIDQGSGVFQVDLQNYEFENRRVFCIKPNQVHQLIVDTHIEGFVISFTNDFMNIAEHEFDLMSPITLYQLFSINEGIFVRNEMIDDMREIAAKMFKEFDNQYPFRVQILKRFLKVLLIYLSRHFEINFTIIKRSRDKELVQKFMTLLEDNFREKKMVSDYANDLFLTSNYLNEIVKKNTGFPASYHIKQRVLLQAKRMSQYSNLCMKEIAYSLGFSTSEHFSKYFKGINGVSYSDFKTKIL